MTDTPHPNAINADTISGDLTAIRQIILSLGSNLGDRAANLRSGVDTLRDTPDITVAAVSPVYETDPVGGPPDAGAFYNIAVLAETTLDAAMLLERCLAIEDAYGRARSEPGAPRTLDVDVVTYANLQLDSPGVQIPHPRAHQRAFVLAPWLDIEPDAELPGHGRVEDLLLGIGRRGVRRLDTVAIGEQ